MTLKEEIALRYKYASEFAEKYPGLCTTDVTFRIPKASLEEMQLEETEIKWIGDGYYMCLVKLFKNIDITLHIYTNYVEY